MDKFNLDITQMDVKTTFLYRMAENEIFMEIPNGGGGDVVHRQTNKSFQIKEIAVWTEN